MFLPNSGSELIKDNIKFIGLLSSPFVLLALFAHLIFVWTFDICVDILYFYGHPPCRKYRKFQLCKSNLLLTSLKLNILILIIIHVSFSITHVF